jgi:hypothetical protein
MDEYSCCIYVHQALSYEFHITKNVIFLHLTCGREIPTCKSLVVENIIETRFQRLWRQIVKIIKCYDYDPTNVTVN